MRKIYKFEPIFKEALWGGERIAPFKGVAPAGAHVGESWEISGVRGSESVVADGDEAGTTLTDLLLRHGSQLMGREVYEAFGAEFPLLVKIIDARLDLSIQVHPGEELSMARHGKHGKSEMWYVIDAAPGAHLLSGWRSVISPAEYAAAVENDTIASLLCDYSVKPGDVFYLPAGRIHSIGAGTFLAEIQQTSDVTYRIYDFNRRDDRGRLRELHTELAADAIDYTVSDNYRTEYTPVADKMTVISHCPHFNVSLLPLTAGHEIDLSGTDKFQVVMVIEGSVTLDADGETRQCRRGETLLIAASTVKLGITPEGEAKLLIATV